MSSLIDLTGRSFGRLYVLGRAGTYRAPGGKGTCPLWQVRCVCGSEKVVNGAKLRSGETTSCGCLRHENLVLRPLRRTIFETPSWSVRKYSQVRVSARKRGYDFSVSRLEAHKMFLGVCYICGEVGTEDRPNGIDRVDNLSGYVDGNVAPCCTQCNKSKLDLSLGHFLAWIQKVYEHNFKGGS